MPFKIILKKLMKFVSEKLAFHGPDARVPNFKLSCTKVFASRRDSSKQKTMFITERGYLFICETYGKVRQMPTKTRGGDASPNHKC